jgi:uncharacterized protein (TIGR02145 family)
MNTKSILKNHLPLFMLAFINFAIFKPEVQNTNSGVLVLKANSKFIVDNVHYGPDGWVGIMTLGASAREQQCIVAKSYPTQEIQSAWDLGLRITNLYYGNNLWFVTMSKGSRFSQQKWFRRDEFPNTDIKTNWDEDLYISDLVYGEGKYTLIMSKATGYTNQRWYKTDEFPRDKIKEGWDEDYYITHINYANNQWILVMTLNNGFTDQKWKIDPTFPMEWIQENWNSQFDLTYLSYGQGNWVAVMSMNGDNTQRLYKPGDIHTEWMKKVWGEQGTVSQTGSLTASPTTTFTPSNPPTTNGKEVKVGTQTWMVENLNVDRFRNGDAIPQAKTQAEWEAAARNGKPAWCYYGNLDANGLSYGKLYNWYAVNDARGLAPTGWRIPTKNDWATLISYSGGETNAGKKLKHFAGWESGGDGQDTYGFKALPSGRREANGNFSLLGRGSLYWTSSNDSGDNAYFVGMFHSDGEVSIRTFSKGNGFAVRCVK